MYCQPHRLYALINHHGLEAIIPKLQIKRLNEIYKYQAHKLKHKKWFRSLKSGNNLDNKSISKSL